MPIRLFHHEGGLIKLFSNGRVSCNVMSRHSQKKFDSYDSIWVVECEGKTLTGLYLFQVSQTTKYPIINQCLKCMCDMYVFVFCLYDESMILYDDFCCKNCVRRL